MNATQRRCTRSILVNTHQRCYQVKSATDFTEKNNQKGLSWLMDLIRNLLIGIDETENELLAIFQVNKRLYHQYQKPVESNDEYSERFEENWNAAEVTGGKNCLVPSKVLDSEKYKSMEFDELKEAIKAIYVLL